MIYSKALGSITLAISSNLYLSLLFTTSYALLTYGEGFTNPCKGANENLLPIQQPGNEANQFESVAAYQYGLLKPPKWPSIGFGD